MSLPTRPLASASVRPAALASALLAGVIALDVASSTLDAGWAPGGGLLPLAALLAWAAASGLGIAHARGSAVWAGAAAVESALLAGPILVGLDLQQLPFGLDPGPVPLDGGQQLALCAEYAVTWAGSFGLGWATAARLRPFPAVAVPGLVLAVNVLNHPDPQWPYVLVFVVALSALLLLTTAVRLDTRSAGDGGRMRAQVRRTARAGALIAGLAIAAGVLLPPASSVDATAGWAPTLPGWNLLQQLSGTAAGSGTALAAGPIGLSTTAGLFGPLTGSDTTTVLTYRPDASVTDEPYYLRAVNLSLASNGEWLPASAGAAAGLAAGEPAPADAHATDVTASVTVSYVTPLVAPSGLVVFPGELRSVDRAVYSRIPTLGGTGFDLVQSRVVGGTYHVTVSFPHATEAELRSAGTVYPAWVDAYRGALTQPGYRSPAALSVIAATARQVAAGAANPYDQASAIESYLRSAFTYTLTPPPAPAGVDPLTYFLTASKAGYCQYFAIAMGDMLRSLGIPARLVNGFGSGTYDPSLDAFVVKASDAHTWVEAYFPGYGWIPFEPTADGTYTTIARALPQPDPAAATPAPATAADVPAAAPAAPGTAILQGAAGLARRAAGNPPLVLVAALAALAVLAVLAIAVRPRSAGAAWSRFRLVMRAAGVPPQPGETPLEFGERVALGNPRAAPLVRRFCAAFSAAAYAPPYAAAANAPSVAAQWPALRAALLRDAISRTRLARAARYRTGGPFRAR